jgi:hypothetical protein
MVVVLDEEFDFADELGDAGEGTALKVCWNLA